MYFPSDRRIYKEALNSMNYPTSFCKFWQTDPRYYQIVVLSSLLLYGISWLNFEIGFFHILTLLFTALSAQSICTKIFKLPRFDPLSPLISALSLCLLLRANSLWLISLTMAVTILSKFVLRWNKKHIFNPTNFGLVAMMLLTGQVWVSPGQWGSGAFLGFLLAGLGGLVILHGDLDLQGSLARGSLVHPTPPTTKWWIINFRLLYDL